MKTKKIYGMAIAVLALVFALAACTDLAGPAAPAGETMPQSMGLARVPAYGWAAGKKPAPLFRA
jgi:hypothetical protein